MNQQFDIGFVATSPVVDTSINAAGDNVGGKLSWTITGTGSRQYMLRSLLLKDQAKQSAAMNLILFKSDPTLTTFSTNVAQDIDDADMSLIIAVIPIVAGDYVALNDNSMACVRNLQVPLITVGSDVLYGCLVTTGTPTYVATTDLEVILGLERLYP